MSKIITIKQKLVEVCIRGNVLSFLPYLIRNEVKTNMPNKIRFYSFFSQKLKCAHKSKKGDLELKIEPIAYEGGNELCYSFYDNFHRGARISIIVKENKKTIKLTTLPF